MTSENKVKQNKLRVFDGFASVVILMLSVNVFSFREIEWKLSVIIAMLFLSMAVEEVLRALYYGKDDKLWSIKHFVYTAVYAICFIVSLVSNEMLDMAMLIWMLYFITLFTGRIISIIRKRKSGNTVSNILILVLILIVCMISMNYDKDDPLPLLYVISFLIVFRTIGHITSISFAQIKLNIIKKILRKTYASEILFGLVMLILSFSSVLVQLEGGIKTYDDALWYCFAIVTTIGFGDFTATTGFGRIISVILGIYGIIVVALVTSIIVNFYNETKDERDEEDEEEDKKKEEKEAEKGEKEQVQEKVVKEAEEGKKSL